MNSKYKEFIMKFGAQMTCGKARDTRVMDSVTEAQRS